MNSEEKKAYNKRWFAEHYANPVWRAKHLARQAELYAKTPDEYKSRARRQRQILRDGPEHYRALARERNRQQRAAKRVLDPTYYREMRLKKKYGIGVADVQAMLAAQKFRCAICPESIDEMTLRVDHDHQTHQVRGLLCHNCNVGIGHLSDSADTLRAAIAYLERASNARESAVGER